MILIAYVVIWNNKYMEILENKHSGLHYNNPCGLIFKLLYLQNEN